MTGRLSAAGMRIEPRGRSLKAEQYSLKYNSVQAALRASCLMHASCERPLDRSLFVPSDWFESAQTIVNRSRQVPQLDISHKWPANPWVNGFIRGRRKYVRYSVSGDR